MMEPPWDFQQTPKGKWICKLELPIGDGASGITVEAEGEGKLGAKTHCALEACKMLDRHGMFDQNAKVWDDSIDKKQTKRFQGQK